MTLKWSRDSEVSQIESLDLEVMPDDPKAALHQCSLANDLRGGIMSWFDRDV